MTKIKVLLNKKILFAGFALVLLAMAASVAFAEGERVSYTEKEVVVKNTNPINSKKPTDGMINVTVCVTLQDRSGRISDANWYFDNISAGKSKKQTAPDGNIVVGASSIMCSVPLYD